jgi:hypothetical protein
MNAMTQKIRPHSLHSPQDADQKEERVIDFNRVREQRLEQKRRKNERVLFKNLLSVYLVQSSRHLIPVDLIDLSEEGCSFQLPQNHQNTLQPKKDEAVLRVYLSQETFLEIFVKLVHSRPAIESHQRFVRYGCEVNQKVQSYQAYRHFVQFLKSYSEHAHRDLGHATGFY